MAKKTDKLKKKSPKKPLKVYRAYVDGKKAIIYAENTQEANKAINLLKTQNGQRNRTT